MIPELDVRVVATEHDYDTACMILDLASKNLRDEGIMQWPEQYPRKPILEAWRNNSLFLGFTDNVAVATARTQLSEPDVWKEDIPALYVHGLAVLPSEAGNQYGEAMLEWGARHAYTQGLRAIRLDCWKQNTKLRGYYERLGFKHKGDVKQTNGTNHWEVAKYELLL